jgi:hypothetical protein
VELDKFNADKQVVAVVAVDLNLQDVDRLIREKTGLGRTGETYVVGSLETKVTFLARSEDKDKSETSNEFKDGVTSFAIEQVMQGKDSVVAVDANRSDDRGTETSDIREARANRLYNNYRNVPVIGVYNWIDDLNLGMIAEMSQAEALLGKLCSWGCRRQVCYWWQCIYYRDALLSRFWRSLIRR